MKKSILLLIPFMLLYCNSNNPVISYQLAPIDSVLTCCGAKKNHDTHYVLFSPGAEPKKTFKKECTMPENVFYRITEYPSGDISLTLVCRYNKKYINLSDETFSY